MSHSIDEPYGFYREAVIKARKEHSCDACQRVIAPGHFYIKASWSWDGRADSVKRCGACQAIHLHLRCMSPGEMWPNETLSCGLDYEKEWGAKPPPEVLALPMMTDEEASAIAANTEPWR